MPRFQQLTKQAGSTHGFNTYNQLLLPPHLCEEAEHEVRCCGVRELDEFLGDPLVVVVAGLPLETKTLKALHFQPQF